MENMRMFDNWEDVYLYNNPEAMYWFCPNLDTDLQTALRLHKINGGKVLDVGTGPGTQAIELSKQGFTAVGTDLSSTAIEKAKARSAREGAKVEFLQDNILQTKLKETFDVIFDRGCFHTLAPDFRALYVENMLKLLKPTGFLFLKCFSILEPMSEGPHKFAKEDIHTLFEPKFTVISVLDSEFQGTVDPRPKALFCTLTKQTAVKDLC